VSEYHKIETLYERDLATFKVKVGEFKNRTYSLLKSWHWTEKIDGTNIRCIWAPCFEAIGEPKKSLTFGGKTDNAQIHADLIKWLYENVSKDKLFEVFPGNAVVLYGEGYGAGIQKGGGLLSPIKKFVLFDVLVEGKWWLSHENVCDVAAKLGLDVVPDFGEMTLEDATDFVRKGFKSKLACSVCDAEGLVGRPLETLFDKKGARLIVKLKTKDFAVTQ
jgi:hypothetical protein